MSQSNTGFLGTFRQYAGKLKTMRDEVTVMPMVSSSGSAIGCRLKPVPVLFTTTW